MASEPTQTTRNMTDAQREYERKRAKKAGLSLEKWLDQKQKQAAAAAAPLSTKPVRKPGLLSRLLDRAHQPLKKKP
jgi:hypothetical protein